MNLNDLRNDLLTLADHICLDIIELRDKGTDLFVEKAILFDSFMEFDPAMDTPSLVAMRLEEFFMADYFTFLVTILAEAEIKVIF